MRASRKRRTTRPQKSGNIRSRLPEIHISGAEGIYEEAEICRTAQAYITRALGHSRGAPDSVVITLERIRQNPKEIPALPVRTLRTSSQASSRRSVEKLLGSLGISRTAVRTALKVLSADQAMRGAALVCASTGRRCEPDRTRGVRVSHLGIDKAAGKALSRQLAKEKIDTVTVREAVILASKVASCAQVEAEVCISDDPDYTTGYVSSRQFGYVRIPHIKKKGSPRGGRVFFIRDENCLNEAIRYLETVPSVIAAASGCRGTCSLDEIVGIHHR